MTEDRGIVPVRVASLPGRTQTVELPADAPTLHQALEAFLGTGYDPGTIRDLRVNNTPVDVGEVRSIQLEAEAIVTIVGRVTGG